MAQSKGCCDRRCKIAMAGAGMIGSMMGYISANKGLADVVLIDAVPNMPLGKALDISHQLPLTNTNVTVTGSNDFADMKDADVVIVTAGLTKVPNKSDKEWDRSDLLPDNSKIMKSVGAAIKQHCPNAFVICITNPLDVMTEVLQQASGVPINKICGMAGALDSARFREFIAEKLQVAPTDVHGLVVGAHGNAMVPLPRYVTVSGIQLSEFVKKGLISEADIKAIVDRTCNAGKEIVEKLGQGSAYYAPATAAMTMAESYLKDQKRVLPCAVKLSGQYGVKDLYVGVPAVIGRGGIEKIIELEFNNEEKEKFKVSVDDIRSLKQKLDSLSL